jgi:hypothetical protein
MFANFLNEIASHGFFIIANGPATGNQLGGQTTYRELIKSMDWLEKSPQAKKWKLDTTKLAVAGQSCGGLEAVCAPAVLRRLDTPSGTSQSQQAWAFPAYSGAPQENLPDLANSLLSTKLPLILVSNSPFSSTAVTWAARKSTPPC